MGNSVRRQERRQASEPSIGERPSETSDLRSSLDPTIGLIIIYGGAAVIIGALYLAHVLFGFTVYG
jgi:hypothetical protein